MSLLQINDVTLNCEVSGAGLGTLVLIHEMGGCIASWDGIANRLAQGCRVVRYDARGSGASTKTPGPYSIDEEVGDLARVLDALGIVGPVALAGAAMGVAVAIRFATRFPERTAAIIGLSPVTGIGESRREGLRAYANKMERGLEPLVDASLRVTYPPELIHDQAVFEAFRARWVSNDPASFAGKYRMLIDLDIRADFAKVRCPTLLIAGSKDPLLTPANVEGLARAIPGARTVEIDSGHFMATQTPGLVIDAIGAFLADLGISSS